jgi:hypothetical protein
VHNIRAKSALARPVFYSLSLVAIGEASNPHALNFADADVIIAPVIEAGCLCIGVTRHALGNLKLAAVGEVVGDPGSAEGMATDFCLNDWTLHEAASPEDTIRVSSIGCQLSLSELYERVQFSQPQSSRLSRDSARRGDDITHKVIHGHFGAEKDAAAAQSSECRSRCRRSGPYWQSVKHIPQRMQA